MRVLVGLTVAGVLVLAGCNGDDSKDKASPSTSPASGSPSATYPAPPATPPTQAPTSAAASPTTGAPSSAPASANPAGNAVPKTKEGAIQRYEQYLHAVGREDLDTVCEIAGPAAKQAENDGFGPCRSTFPITFQMLSAGQKNALKAATVDPKLVVMRGPATFVVPMEAVKSTASLAGGVLDESQTLEYLNNNWYVTD